MPVAIKKILFNPLLSSLSEVQAFLRSHPAGTAHAFSRVLYVWDGKGEFETIDLTGKPDSYFLDDVRLNALGDVLSERMQLHEAALQKITGYEIITSPGRTITTPLQADKIALFALSLSGKPNYFDLLVINNSADVVCYNAMSNSSIRGLKHSGDLLGRGSVLLHHLNATADLTTEPFAVGLSGYTNQPLHRYKAQNPAVLLVNHETETAYLVPVPLDAATIGNATLCFPLVGQRICGGTEIRWAILPNAPVPDAPMHASGSNLRPARGTVREALQAAADILKEKPDPLPVAVRKAPPVPVDTEVKRVANSKALPPVCFRWSPFAPCHVCHTLTFPFSLVSGSESSYLRKGLKYLNSFISRATLPLSASEWGCHSVT